MPRDIAGRFAAAGGVTHMHGVSQVEMLDHGGNIGGVVIHVVTVAHLRRAAMAAPVVSDNAVALIKEVEHLRIPVVGAQRPPMVEHDRLSALWAPILVDRFPCRKRTRPGISNLDIPALVAVTLNAKSGTA